VHGPFSVSAVASHRRHYGAASPPFHSVAGLGTVRWCLTRLTSRVWSAGAALIRYCWWMDWPCRETAAGPQWWSPSPAVACAVLWMSPVHACLFFSSSPRVARATFAVVNLN